MKKILFIHANAALYGSDICLIELVKHIEGFQKIVVLPSDGPLNPSLKNFSKVIISDTAPLRKPSLSMIWYGFSLLRATGSIINIINKEKPDIIYCNTSTLPSGLIAANLKGIPCIVHVREIITSKILCRILAWTTYILATKIICISKEVEQSFFGKCNKKKIQVIYDGVDTTDFKPTPMSKKQKQYHIGMIGRITPWKGQELFIAAAKEVIKSNPETIFFIIGDPDNKENKLFKKFLEKEIQRTGLQKKIVFTGFQSNIKSVIASLDVVVLPSIKPEPSGKVILEAMAMEKPVIATNHGGPTELIANGKTGFLVPPKKDDLANKLRFIVTHPKIGRKMGKEGKKRIVKLFSLERNIQEISNLLKKI